MSDNTKQDLIRQVRNYFTKENKFLSLVSRLAISQIEQLGLNNPQFIVDTFKNLTNYISPYVPPLAPLLNVISSEVVTTDNVEELLKGNKIPFLCNTFKSPFKMISNFLPEKMKNTVNETVNNIFSEENIREASNGNLRPIFNSIKEKGGEIFRGIGEKIKKDLPSFLSGTFTEFFEKNKSHIPEVLQAPIEKISHSLLSEDFISKPIETIVNCVGNFVNNFISKKLETLFPESNKTKQQTQQQMKENLTGALDEISSLTQTQNKQVE